MANLCPGVLVKLLQEMGADEKVSSEDPREPILLQIRSIIPVLAEGDLWPKQGFYLRVSDSSHAMYVSLPQEHDDMVLCNKLQLGQFIYVEKLEVAYPVPMLKGIKPVPGGQPCIGNLEDLVAIDNLVNVCGASKSVLVREKDTALKKKPRGRVRSLSPSKLLPPNEKTGRRTSRSRDRDVERTLSDVIMKGSRKTSIEKDSDSESTTTTSSSSSATTAKRRSWHGTEISHCPIVKHGIRPTAHSRSACVSPVRSVKYDSSDDNSCSKTKRKDIGIDMKSVKSSDKSRTCTSAKSRVVSLDPAVLFSLVNDNKLTETSILWNSLPSTLVKLGKEVLRHRDVSLLAAVEALQEASAAERSLKCLSTYSELQSAKEDDQQLSVDKFFSLQHDLVRTQSIIQSLTNISPLKADDSDSNGPGSIREAVKLALERKKNATAWIKAALASDLTPLSAPVSVPMGANNAASKSSTPRGSTPKGTFIVRTQRSNGEIHIGLAAEKEPQDWVKGNSLNAAADLTNFLNDDCRRWFLGYVENYLDGVKSKTMSLESDSEVAELMRQMKRVNDWLDVMANKETNSPKFECKDNNSTVGESELEAYGRVRNKIYGILLKHVERTAMAFENMHAIAEG